MIVRCVVITFFCLMIMNEEGEDDDDDDDTRVHPAQLVGLGRSHLPCACRAVMLL